MISLNNAYVSRELQTGGVNSILAMVSLTTWIIMLSVVLLLAVLYAGIAKKERGNHLLNDFFAAIGLSMSQGASDEIFSLSGRTLHLTLLLLGFFLLNYFAALLASYLSMEKEPVFIKSDFDILNYKQDLYTIGNSATSASFKNAVPGTAIRTIWDEQVK